MTERLLSVRDLAVAFPTGAGETRAVDGLSLDLDDGEMLALVGPSGCGKSVTALTLMGLTDRSARVAGSARFAGGELVGAPEARLRRLRGAEMAMVFQDPLSSLNPVERVGDQIAEQIRAHEPVTARDARARAVALLERVGIPAAARRAEAYPHELSGGMRQRAMIAMALSCGPRLLIADEPTTALDVTVQAQILELVHELRDQTGAAVLLITHDFGVVAEIADRVAVMDAGRIVEAGPVEDVFDAPRHPRTRALLDAIPRIDEPLDRPPPAATTAGPVLAVDRLEVAFAVRRGLLGRRAGGSVRAVDGVSLAVGRGEALGLVGESGCGKTTLARAATRLLEPTAGTVTFDGRDITRAGRRELAPLRSELQIVFQDPEGALNPRKRVEDIVGLPLRVQGWSREAAAGRVAELLERVGLAPEHAIRWPHELSGGQRQRIGIARALAPSPRVMVLDEPVTALDVAVQAQIIDLLAELRHELGLAYLFVAHDLAVVRRVCDRVAVMYMGRLMEVAPAAVLYRSPVHPYTAALLAAVPAPDPRAARRRRAAAARAAAGEPAPADDQPSGCVFHPRCPRASAVCGTVEPPLVAHRDGAFAACHHPLDA